MEWGAFNSFRKKSKGEYASTSRKLALYQRSLARIRTKKLDPEAEKWYWINSQALELNWASLETQTYHKFF